MPSLIYHFSGLDFYLFLTRLHCADYPILFEVEGKNVWLVSKNFLPKGYEIWFFSFFILFLVEKISGFVNNCMDLNPIMRIRYPTKRIRLSGSVSKWNGSEKNFYYDASMVSGMSKVFLPSFYSRRRCLQTAIELI